MGKEQSMRSWMNRVALAALCAVAGAEAKDAVKTESVSWPTPWESPTTLVYDSTTVGRTERKGQVSEYRLYSTARISGSRLADGYQQSWGGDQVRVESENIDPDQVEMLSVFLRALEGRPLVVDLDSEGNYTGIRDLAEWRRLLRSFYQTMLETGIREGIGNLPAEQADAAFAKAWKIALPMLDTMTSESVVEGMLSELPATYNAFASGSFILDKAAAVDTELESPVGGMPIPAKVNVRLTAPADAPNLVHVRLETRIDSEKAAPALREIVGIMFPDLLVDERMDKEVTDLVRELSIGSDVDYLIDRRTGIVQSLTIASFKHFPGKKENETTTMRLRP